MHRSCAAERRGAAATREWRQSQACTLEGRFYLSSRRNVIICGPAVRTVHEQWILLIGQQCQTRDRVTCMPRFSRSFCSACTSAITMTTVCSGAIRAQWAPLSKSARLLPRMVWNSRDPSFPCNKSSHKECCFSCYTLIQDR